MCTLINTDLAMENQAKHRLTDYVKRTGIMIGCSLGVIIIRHGIHLMHEHALAW